MYFLLPLQRISTFMRLFLAHAHDYSIDFENMSEYSWGYFGCAFKIKKKKEKTRMQIKQGKKTKFFVFKCAVQSLRCVINTKRQVFRSSSLSRLLKGSPPLPGGREGTIKRDGGDARRPGRELHANRAHYSPVRRYRSNNLITYPLWLCVLLREIMPGVKSAEAYFLLNHSQPRIERLHTIEPIKTLPIFGYF